MKTYIAAFFLLLSATFVAAHPYLIQRLGIEQGLSNNYVLSITQDKGISVVRHRRRAE